MTNIGTAVEFRRFWCRKILSFTIFPDYLVTDPRSVAVITYTTEHNCGFNTVTPVVNLALHPSGVGKSSTSFSCMAGVKVGMSPLPGGNLHCKFPHH